ncbi:hypothetical protein MAMMFC1_01348 [Methylomusa anaerophila]|uniref:Uncharacterized protein n=1 Tax=Methylomusa anaerophila TaxID=1930071 RepID=A0A348AHY9_9FIRM|nr:hypothetical protein MAMMFC1_01348 [Methylomusa anaerophila]
MLVIRHSCLAKMDILRTRNRTLDHHSFCIVNNFSVRRRVAGKLKRREAFSETLRVVFLNLRIYRTLRASSSSLAMRCSVAGWVLNKLTIQLPAPLSGLTINIWDVAGVASGMVLC